MFVSAGATAVRLKARSEMDSEARLRLALTALEVQRTPGRIDRALEVEGIDGLVRNFADLDPAQRQRINDDVDGLLRREIDVVIRWTSDYPQRLHAVAQAPPLLFYWGNRALLDCDGVGMCGARDCSPAGLEAARICGEQVAALGLNVISGYARGVDTETHLGALRGGGRTLIVLAEGINRFKQKRAFSEVELDPERMAVISQFAPGQVWTVGNAMARNTVIAGLARALVVVEAGESGGTLNAGMRALQMRRPVLALDFSIGTPTGNQALFEKGAVRVSSSKGLRASLDRLKAESAVEGRQLHLI